jgi:SpoVK/Ycf46/Vps4 family AAA+-type ATPase
MPPLNFPSFSYSAKPVNASSQTVSSESEQNWLPIVMYYTWDFFKLGASLYITWRMVSFALKGNEDGSNKEAKKDLAKRLKRPEIELLDFSKHEQHYFNHIIGPGDIDSSFNDIGGLESELEDVKENVILPIRVWNRFKSFKGFTTCPTGVLLYGLPGTGKSLIAKAIAKGRSPHRVSMLLAFTLLLTLSHALLEANATFINVKASVLMDKYLGESDKLASALFSLGRKLAPTIIFLDEVDTILRKRDSSSLDKNMSSAQVCTAANKAIFLCFHTST